MNSTEKYDRNEEDFWECVEKNLKSMQQSYIKI